MRKVWIVAAVIGLSGCATGINPQKYNDAPASPDSFKLCHGYSCTYKTATGLTRAEWNKVAAIFKPAAKSAEAERGKIGKAIALMERRIGARTGTSEDLPMAGTFKESVKQLDCIDETINTTHYIGFLEKAGLLKFYKITDPTHRGYIIDGTWPHNTAVIEEIKTGRRYVVDSFYRANGEEPYIMSRDQWLGGWRPPGATQ